MKKVTIIGHQGSANQKRKTALHTLRVTSTNKMSSTGGGGRKSQMPPHAWLPFEKYLEFLKSSNTELPNDAEMSILNI